MFLKGILAKAKAAKTMEEIDDTLEAIFKKLDRSMDKALEPEKILLGR